MGYQSRFYPSRNTARYLLTRNAGEKELLRITFLLLDKAKSEEQIKNALKEKGTGSYYAVLNSRDSNAATSSNI